MAMAQKLLSLPKSFEGVVVECGCFRGGSTANLSIICDLLGAGSGLPLGFFYTGPWGQNAPTENPASIAYTRKHFSGVWEFYPDED
jgi:hypothetical protein